MLLELDSTTDSSLLHLSDEALLRESRVTPSVFAHLVRRYEDAFMRKASRILGKREDAEDAVQETFTKIYLASGKFVPVPGATFSSWAYKILLNTCFTHYKRNKRHAPVSFRMPEGFEELIPDGHSQFDANMLSDFVASALSRIPSILQRVLTLHFLEGKSHKEIADEEGISVGAIKTRTYRAKEAFRQALVSVSTTQHQ